MDNLERQRLYDRSRPEYTQAKGHNQRVKDEYPQAWAESTITNEILGDWIKEHADDKCVYCQKAVKEVDHIVPLSKGGPHDVDNLQMLCMDCNRSKSDMTHEEFVEWRKVNKPERKGVRLTDFGIDYSVLKHGTNRARTRSLFKEMWNLQSGKDLPPIFSLKAHDHTDAFISLRKLYLDIGDPTEYKFAKAVFNDPNHWRRLNTCQWFKPFVREWRAELKAKIRAESVERLIGMSINNLQANRALATEDYLYVSYLELDDPASKPKRAGRPTKDRTPETISDEELAADAERIGL